MLISDNKILPFNALWESIIYMDLKVSRSTSAKGYFLLIPIKFCFKVIYDDCTDFKI